MARASARSSGRGRCSLDSRTWEAGGWGEGSVSVGTSACPLYLSGSTHRVQQEARKLEEAEHAPSPPPCLAPQIPPLLPGAAVPSAPSRPEAGGIAELSRQSLARKDLEKEECGLSLPPTADFQAGSRCLAPTSPASALVGFSTQRDNRLENSQARRGVCSPGVRAGLALGTGETHLSHSERKNGRGSCLVSEWSRVAGEQALLLGARARDR